MMATIMALWTTASCGPLSVCCASYCTSSVPLLLYSWSSWQLMYASTSCPFMQQVQTGSWCQQKHAAETAGCV